MRVNWRTGGNLKMSRASVYVFSAGYRLVIPYTYVSRFKVASSGSNISEVGLFITDQAIIIAL